jgi:hypothetical protein
MENDSLFRVVTYDRRHMDMVDESPWFPSIDLARRYKHRVGVGEGYFTVIFQSQGNSMFELVWDYEG